METKKDEDCPSSSLVGALSQEHRLTRPGLAHVALSLGNAAVSAGAGVKAGVGRKRKKLDDASARVVLQIALEGWEGLSEKTKARLAAAALEDPFVKNVIEEGGAK
jgi:hypothetical protein